MKTIITGASGNYGRAAVERVLAKGVPAEDLILMSRTPAKLDVFAERGCVVRKGDFDDPASLASAFIGGEQMLLISGTRVGKRIPQHRAAIEQAVAAGVGHIIYTSFVGLVDGNPAEACHDHAATEAMLRDSGAEYTALRDQHYADAMVLNYAPNALQSGKWVMNTGQGREALVWRDDCIDSAVGVLTSTGHGNKVYNITGPELLRLQDVAAMIASAVGRDIEYIDVDDEGMYALFDSLGVPRQPVDDLTVAGLSWNSDDMVTFGQAVREGYFAVISDDVEKLTGRKPRSVQQMIDANIEVLREAARA